MDYLLIYDYAPDYLERRDQFRNEHLTLAWTAQSAGTLILGGALANPADGAILHFRAASPIVVEAFAQADPYVRHGLVTRWQVREWTTVVGESAGTPIRPEK